MDMAGTGGGSGVPPGFRFHPTDEELLQFYLKKKISFQKFDMDVIREVDLNKIEPWELQERCSIGSGPQNEWYFFSHKDRKYPTGSRTNRATGAGFWKATGRDKCIRNNKSNKIGMRKTLVFYRGRAPHGQKTDWIMHEYRHLDDPNDHITTNDSQQPTSHPPREDGIGWVVCRVFKKKNLFKATSQHTITSSSNNINSINQHNLLYTTTTTTTTTTPTSPHDDHHHHIPISIFPSPPHLHYPPPPDQNNRMINPLILTNNNNYHHHHHHLNLLADHQTQTQTLMAAPSSMLNTEDCETASPNQSRDHIAAGDGDHPLVVATSHQLCEMDFWAYGK